MPGNVADAIRLMLVTDDAYLPSTGLVASIHAAVRGGVTSVQLRLKRASASDIAALARALLPGLGVPLLIDDRPDIALAVGAAGVHLGDGDVAPRDIRRLWPEAGIIGASVGLPEEIAFGAGGDYWGVGPWRESTTKTIAGPAIGRAGFSRIVAAADGTPCIAIGSVTPDDVPAVLELGGAGVAVVSGILGAADIEAAARRYALRLLTG